MGLDNGIYVKSNRRKVTRNMLPSSIRYCWDEEYYYSTNNSFN